MHATAAALPVGRSPWTPERLGWVALRVAFGALLIWVLWLGVLFAQVPNTGPAAVTGDHELYMAAARRWMAGDSFYMAYQLAGPYDVVMTEILYPPTILPLLALSAVMPDVLWWVIPIGIVTVVTIYWRPSLLGWTLVLACLAFPITFESVAYGNPGMWIAAFVALGTVYGWPAVLVALKPTLAPFMLVGARRRSWWVAVVVLIVASLFFFPLWLDYATVLTNARGPLVSPLYSVTQVPLLLLPLAAWVGRTRGPHTGRGR